MTEPNKLTDSNGSLDDTPCDFLEWDTQFFGKRIGSVRGNTLTPERMTHILKWSEELAVDCLYFLGNTDDSKTIRIAENHGFYFQSVRTVVERPLTNIEVLDLAPLEGLVLRSGTPNDLETLRPVARHAYNWTRFYNDPCFPEEKCEEMYDIWLTKSINREMADEVVVAEYNGTAVGYMTCRLSRTPNSSEGLFQLLGVDETRRGIKIGQRVIVQAMKWLAEQGMTTVSLATQGHNVPVIRFYERLGFTTRSIQFWYHKWFNDCDSE